MKKLLIGFLLSITLSANAQVFVVEESDSTVKSEYNDGLLWTYKQIDDLVVGMANYVNKDGYGKNYQIQIFIKNLGDSSVTFDPALVTSTLCNKHDENEELKVYSYDDYMKKIKTQQAWAMAMTGFSAGMNAGMAGYHTTYTTTYGAGHMPYTQVHTTYNYAAASAANMAATTQMMTLSKMMSDDKKTISKGYLKITTIHPDEGIIGYINIKHRKGKMMTVNIPVGDHIYSFKWNVAKAKKK